MALSLSQPFSSAAERDRVEPYVRQLHEEGYVVIRGAASTDIVGACSSSLDDRFHRTPYCNGYFYGGRSKRFGRALRYSRDAARLVQSSLVIAIAEAILGRWCDTIQLNLTQGIEIHPGAPAQFPHRDQDMWGAPKGELEYLINVMWPFSPYTPENGSTVIWPGSHRWPSDAMPDANNPGISLTLSPGDTLIFLGSTLHHGGANVSTDVRRGLIVSYSLGWLRTYENQFLAYPPEVARHFDPILAELVGYRQHRPNLGNYEGQSPAVLLSGGLPDHLAATDELKPEQQAMVDLFMMQLRHAA